MADPSDNVNARTVRKLDLILLPYVSLLFLLNAMDRSNIGNAETADFTSDVGLKPSDLNTAVSCFFVSFVFLQPIGASLGRRFGMATFVPTVMTIWGVLTALHLAVRKKWQLILIRFLIGSLEAGFYPTTVSYLSLFYTRFEFAKRLGFFYGQYAVASAVGGVLSYTIFRYFPPSVLPKPGSGPLPHTGPPLMVRVDTHSWKPWQVLFLAEGCLTVIAALIGFWLLPHSASTAWFLKPDERAWAEKRILIDRQVFESSSQTNSGLDKSASLASSAEDHASSEDALEGLEEAEMAHLLSDSSSSSGFTPSMKSSNSMTNEKGLSRRDILDAVLDWKVWYALSLMVCVSVPINGFTIFLPLVVKGLGFDSAMCNLMTAPPFVAGVLVLWLFMYLSDARRSRLSYAMGGLGITFAGLAIIAVLPEKSAFSWKYLALCIMISGCFVSSPLTTAWLSGNMTEPGKRSVVLGINGLGNVAGIISGVLFAPRFGPSYRVSFFVTLLWVVLALPGYALFRWLLVRQNRSRKRIVAGWGEGEVERERRYGTGGGGELWTGWQKRVREWADPTGMDVGRRGDQRMTFTYGL